MVSFRLNGRATSVQNGTILLKYLREVEKLTSVKNGCDEGVCGACTILIDGKAVRCCTMKVDKLQDKEVLTVEGLSELEREIYSNAFAEAGAVQCGFCTPGMVLSAKALLDQNLNPAEEDIKKAIRNNICRCTGYVKIINAIMLAAEALRELKHIRLNTCKSNIGQNWRRIDAIQKALGEATYCDDVFMDDMLYVSVLRAMKPRARVLSIDTVKAGSLEGVEAVLTAAEVPGENYQGYIFKDWPTFVPVGEMTRCAGDAVAAVVARTKEIADEALQLIEVKYEEMEPVTDPKRALEEDAPKIHEKGNLLSRTYVKRGNPEEALAASKYTVKNTYKTPPLEHAFIEPESTVAFYDGDVLTLYVATQSVTHDHHEICRILGLPHDKVRVILQNVGGGFGGKEDLSVQHYAALGTFYTKKPCKYTFTREESLLCHPKRHGMELEITTGCDDQGILTAMTARIIADTGAYASLGTAVLERACTHACGPYSIPNIELDGYCVYTNNPPAGAFRGFGVPQSNFGAEANMDQLADLAGLDRWEIRYRNAVEPGMVLANGQICGDDVAIKETLLAVKDDYYNNKYAGIACAFKNTGIGVGLPDIGRCRIRVKDGKVVIYSAASCIGQGLATVMIQIVSETVGIDGTNIIFNQPDSSLCPDSGATTASRQTLFTGEACRQAALKLKTELEIKTLEELEGQDFEGEFNGITDPIKSGKENPISHVAYGYATHVVILNDDGKVAKIVAAHDIGKAINPLNVEGQVEGGVIMGLGSALREKLVYEKGLVKSKFGTLGLLRATEIPEIDVKIIEKNLSELAFGAKGIGEIALIPVAAAVASAYERFDGIRRLELPLEETPYNRKKVKE
ncbi:MAG TPA: selenium-dependent xanthine dehydrogenase [Clostridia bacterium]|nr:selenium-dependent xanthine dehydrogenase [Clostridia bacterium]